MTRIRLLVYATIPADGSPREFFRRFHEAEDRAREIPGGGIVIEYLAAASDVVDLLVAALNDRGWFRAARAVAAHRNEHAAEVTEQRRPLLSADDDLPTTRRMRTLPPPPAGKDGE